MRDADIPVHFGIRNQLDRVAFGSPHPTKLGIVASGKAYLDCIGALHQLGIEYDKEVMTPIGRPMRLSEGNVIKSLLKTV